MRLRPMFALLLAASLPLHAAEPLEYYDARKLADGPVCRIMLPGRISSGTHATWGQGQAIRAAQGK